MSTLGSRIKERRKTIGLTQSDLAGADLSSGMVSLIERDMTNPSLKTLEHLAKTLGVSVDYLLNKKESEEDSEESGNVALKRLEGLIRSDRLIEAQKILDEVSHDRIHSSLKGMFYKLKGELAIARKEDLEAIEAFEQGIIYMDTQDMDEYAGIYYQLAHCYTNVFDFRKGIELSLQGILLLNTSHTNTNTLLRLKLMYIQAYGHCRVKEFEKGIHIIDEAMRIMKQTSCHYNEGMYCMLSGLASLYLKDYAKGIESTRRALSLLDEEEQAGQVIGCLTNLGILTRESGELDESRHYLQESLRLALRQDQESSIGNSSFELATTYYVLNQGREAKELCEQYMGRLDDHSTLKVKMLFLLGQIELDRQENTTALRFVEKAMESAEKLGDRTLMAKGLSMKANIFKRQGLDEEAFEYLLSSVQLYESMRHTT
ncbi:helix-turn-helix domain-containing protein [Exiguobacterium sp. s192]|uniref:helix-turn-helix domain-containing protein n=1 Tax=Exiguobacterium sp. s192 TaxID=2751206 RepID=UPI001BE6D584|nr:helix-turn-helix domain-containing protein [Exiguobacterium sp. s192]